MNASLEQAWERIGFDDAERVEALLTKGAVTGVLGGAAGGVVAALAGTAHAAAAYGVAFATALMLLVLPRLGWGVLVSLTGAVLLLPVFTRWTPAVLPYFFTVPLGLALALEPLPPLRRLLVLGGPSLGAAWFLWVARWLAARHLGSAAPVLTLAALLGSGLFVAGGAALAWLSFSFDLTASRLVKQPKVRLAWLRVRAALGRLPKGPGRARLERLVTEGAARCFEARVEREAAAATIDAQAEREAREAVRALEERAAQVRDPELLAHLQQLLRVHRDTLEQLDGLRRRAERLEAREAAEAGWLETAAFSLELAPKGEGGLSDLGARLEALGRR